jgi:hypothetical protein
VRSRTMRGVALDALSSAIAGANPANGRVVG